MRIHSRLRQGFISFRKFPNILRTLSCLLCDSSYKTLIKSKFFTLIYSHTCTTVYIKHDNLIPTNSCFTLTISRLSHLASACVNYSVSRTSKFVHSAYVYFKSAFTIHYIIVSSYQCNHVCYEKVVHA